MKFFLSTIIIFIFTSLNVLNSKELKIDEIKNLNSKVFFMRHALAPGVGDPENFKLDDCSTQRNLSNDGIDQARKISNEFNKLILYRGDYWHSGLNYFGNTIYDSRLFQTFFFTTEDMI